MDTILCFYCTQFNQDTLRCDKYPFGNIPLLIKCGMCICSDPDFEGTHISNEEELDAFLDSL